MSSSATSFRHLVLPKEHGSWSLAFEPVALGLLVAPSAPGAALALAVAAGFFVRRPLKLSCTCAAVDARRVPAAMWAMIFSVAAVSALAFSVSSAGELGPLWPLLLAAPCGAAFLWFDLRNDMREAEAELAGSAAFAVLPAVFATLAGWTPAAALALAALSFARSMPTVLTVRTYLRLQKRQAVNPLLPLAAAVVALLACALLARQQLLPFAAVALPALLLGRTALFVTPLRPALTAKQVGMIEAGLGVVYLGGTALAYGLTA